MHQITEFEIEKINPLTYNQIYRDNIKCCNFSGDHIQFTAQAQAIHEKIASAFCHLSPILHKHPKFSSSIISTKLAKPVNNAKYLLAWQLSFRLNHTYSAKNINALVPLVTKLRAVLNTLNLPILNEL